MRFLAFVLIAVIAGCTAPRPAPVAERTPIARPAPAAPPAAKPAAPVQTPAPAPAETVVTAPLKSPGGTVEAKPLSGTAAPAPAPTVIPGEKLVTEPKAVRLPYSDQALAQLAQAPAPAPVPEGKPDTRPSAATPKSPEDLDWIWPTSGKVISTFNDATTKGIAIAGRPGQPVVAAAPGRVIFSGTGIRGFGRLIVIKHNETYLSVYAHNNQLLVKEGQTVSRGQRIAEMGNTDADQVKLHFEIRRFGKPIDPLRLLPPG